MKHNRLRKQIWMAMLIALGYVLSPILRVPGMAPMQHFINVIAAVTTGPAGAFLVALIINILRMLLMGITPLALTGSVFGAALAGHLFVRFKTKWAAAAGEWIGTGLIGSILSYPVMHYVMGVGEIGWFTYVPGFIVGTTIGSILGLLFVGVMQRFDFFREMMNEVIYKK